MTTSAPVLAIVDRNRYVPLLVADRPRAIDEVIDYFGSPPRPREIRPRLFLVPRHAG